jgi:integrase
VRVTLPLILTSKPFSPTTIQPDDDRCAAVDSSDSIRRMPRRPHLLEQPGAGQQRRQTTPSPGGLVDKNTKGKRAREVPLIDPIRDLVERRIELADHDPDARLFTGPKGGRITTPTLRDATSWDDVVTELGYEQLKRHDLRHTGLTWLADAGVPVHILRKIAGHGTLTTTQRYLHPDRQSVTNAGDLLSRHPWSPNGPQLRVISS